MYDLFNEYGSTSIPASLCRTTEEGMYTTILKMCAIRVGKVRISGYTLFILFSGRVREIS